MCLKSVLLAGVKIFSVHLSIGTCSKIYRYVPTSITSKQQINKSYSIRKAVDHLTAAIPSICTRRLVGFNIPNCFY